MELRWRTRPWQCEFIQCLIVQCIHTMYVLYSILSWYSTFTICTNRINVNNHLILLRYLYACRRLLHHVTGFPAFKLTFSHLLHSHHLTFLIGTKYTPKKQKTNAKAQKWNTNQRNGWQFVIALHPFKCFEEYCFFVNSSIIFDKRHKPK